MNISSTFSTWLAVLTHPGEEIFSTERTTAQANLVTALIWIVAAATISALLSFIRGQLFLGSMSGFEQVARMSDMPPEVAAQLSDLLSRGFMSAFMGIGSILSIVWQPIVFLIFVGILHFVAMALGGQGEYGRYAYLFATFQAPIMIVSAVLAFAPLVGACLSFLLAIYSMVLAYFATRVEYGLSGGRAVIVVAVPLILAMIVGGCALFGIISLMFAFGDV